jgi:hypothetical protein
MTYADLKIGDVFVVIGDNQDSLLFKVSAGAYRDKKRILFLKRNGQCDAWPEYRNLPARIDWPMNVILQQNSNSKTTIVIEDTTPVQRVKW